MYLCACLCVNVIRSDSKPHHTAQLSWPTARQGHYIYTSGWDAMGSDDTASIFSRNLSLSAPANLTFWYHMNGNGVGSLALYVHPTAGGGTGAPRWRAQHRQGMQWKEQTVLLESGSWQVGCVVVCFFNLASYRYPLSPR